MWGNILTHIGMHHTHGCCSHASASTEAMEAAVEFDSKELLVHKDFY